MVDGVANSRGHGAETMSGIFGSNLSSDEWPGRAGGGSGQKRTTKALEKWICPPGARRTNGFREAGGETAPTGTAGYLGHQRYRWEKGRTVYNTKNRPLCDPFLQKGCQPS